MLAASCRALTLDSASSSSNRTAQLHHTPRHCRQVHGGCAWHLRGQEPMRWLRWWGDNLWAVQERAESCGGLQQAW